MAIKKLPPHLLKFFRRPIYPTKDYLQIKQQGLLHLHQTRDQSKVTTAEKAPTTAMQVTIKMELAIDLAVVTIMTSKDQALGWSMAELLAVDQLQVQVQPLLEVP